MLYNKFCIASFLLTGINLGLSVKKSGLFINKNHQVTEEITLSLQVENIAISPKVPNFLFHSSAHKACAQSSINTKSLDCAKLENLYISAGFQKVC
jgi:hypothetical protein